MVSVHLVSFLAPKWTFYEWQSSLIEKIPKFNKEGMINIKIIQNNIKNTTNNNLLPVLELKIFHLIWVLIKGALFLSRSVVAAHSTLKTSGEPISEIQYYKYFNSKICSLMLERSFYFEDECALWIKTNNKVF